MSTAVAAKTSKDDYLAAVNHIANIVRHDIYPESTLNTLPLRNPRLLHLGPLPAPILPHLPRIRTAHSALAHHKRYQSMWKTIELMKPYNLSVSPQTLSLIIEEFDMFSLAKLSRIAALTGDGIGKKL
ncbi:hypothetical protein WN944_005739 [Citrus x changshan-huyou]|uniref:Uncharacterized protein n=1 Tax=Citrus x changshan-huyou TaxID=2935761 RepID=A0AAP0MHX7_9ROSI